MGVLGGRRQSAMMACVLLLAAASLVPSVALPQTTQGQRSVDFVIPAGALPDALTAFGVAANLQMLYPTDMAQGRRSPGVSGRLSPEEALRQLLAGTGLTFRFTAVDTVTLERLPAASSGVTTLDPVTVSGDNPVPPQAMIDNLPPAYAGGQVATGGQLGLLGNRDFQDVPFNITAYTSKLMQDQQARSIADVVANDSSVRNAWAAVSYTAPLMVRGFAVSNQDLAFGGLYGVAPALTVSPEFLERVEVLRGPGALLNGIAPQGSIGGNINLVPKRATDAPVTSLTLNYYSESQVGGHVDIGRRFGKDNAFGVRFNGVYRGGSTPVDRQRQEIGAAVLGLDYRGDRFRLSLDAGYQQQLYNAPSRPTYVNAGVPVPTAPSGTSNWFQSWTYANTRDTYGVVRAEYDLAENWTAYAAVGGRRNDMDAVTGFATVLNAQANINDAPLNFPIYVRSNTQEIGLRGRVATGPVRHDLSISGNRLQLENGQLNPTVRTIASNLYHPVLVPRPVYAALNPPRTAATQLKSLAIADTLSAFDDRAQLTLGLRQQQVRVHNYAAATGLRTTAYNEGALTPAVALVVKPWRNVSLYANYIQGLQPGQVAPATARNAGQVFKPFVSTQYEAGVKADFGSFSSTLSLFQIEQDSGFVNPATMTYAVDGRQRNRGVELNGFGEPLPGVRLLGGVTLIDGELVATAGGINNGKTATAVPRVQLNLGGEWDLPFVPGLTASARAVYTGSQYLDVANTQSIPSWTRFDIGARYTFDGPGGRPVTIRANIENLFDRNYWASAGANFGLALGQPRTFLASTTFTF